MLLLLHVQQNGLLHYAIGNWQAPFGIILVADTLSVLLVCLTSFLALGAICYGSAGEDEKGSFFHPLFQFQIMGINGAFLTGDLFNLFVFFEVLLIASYALLLHGRGAERAHREAASLVPQRVVQALQPVLVGQLRVSGSNQQQTKGRGDEARKQSEGKGVLRHGFPGAQILHSL